MFMKTNQDYKDAALAALKGHWGPAVLFAFVFFCISAVSSFFEPTTASILQLAITICVVLPLGVGVYNAFRNLLLGQSDDFVGGAFRIGFNNWQHNVGGMLLMTVYTLLWTLCLIVPGIIKSFSYALTPFILNERPELSADEAIELSMKMMVGHKMELFLLYLSFIGWYLLAVLTCCIGFLWLVPYIYTAQAAFYEDVKAEYESRQDVAA